MTFFNLESQNSREGQVIVPNFEKFLLRWYEDFYTERSDQVGDSVINITIENAITCDHV